MTTGIMTKTIIAKYFKTQPALKAWFFGSYSQSEQTKDKEKGRKLAISLPKNSFYILLILNICKAWYACL